MRLAVASLALALAACGGEGDQAPLRESAVTAGDVMRGEWLVASSWGDPPSDTPGIRISIGDNIAMQSQCVTAQWNYSVLGDEVRTRFVPTQTCLRPLLRDEQIVQDQITAGFTFALADDGTLHLESGVGPMVLEPFAATQESRAAKEVGSRMPQPADPWPDTVQGDWRLAGVDGEPFEADYGVAVHIGPDRIEFENCQQIAWSYRHEGDTITTRRTPAITIDIMPKPQPCALPLAPQIDGMVTAIDAADTVTRTPENGVRLSGQGRSVLLFGQ